MSTLRTHFRTLALLALAACVVMPLSRADDNKTPKAPPKRIVSMAPSITEVLFALGVGDRLVGDTRYCDYPAEAKKVAKIGGYMDPNYEAIVAQRPDLVVLLDSHKEAIERLQRMHIATLAVPHETVKDILDAITTIGDACGVPEKAKALREDLTRRTEAVRRAIAGKPRPRVLVCIGRDTDSGKLAGMYMAGRNDYYNEIIETAGGVNAYEGREVAFPQISAEGVIQIAPDVIIDLVAFVKSDSKTEDAIVKQWQQLKPVKAVRNGRVHVIVGTQALRPGPRYILFLEEVARILHPEAFADKTGENKAAK